MDPSLELVASNKSFGGWHKRYRHRSASLNAETVFAIYLPPQAASKPVPVLYWLSGLTCTEENFITKAYAQLFARKFGIVVIAPDTSPRGAGEEISTRPFQLVTGRVWRGSAFGGVRGRSELPGYVERAQRGEIPLDTFITHTMGLADINHAFELMHEGKSIRSVIHY